MIGCFFPTDFLEELKEIVMEEENDEIELIPFLQGFLAGGDMKDYEYIKNMIMLDVDNTIKYPDEEYPSDSILVSPFVNLPEHLSVKELKLI